VARNARQNNWKDGHKFVCAKDASVSFQSFRAIGQCVFELIKKKLAGSSYLPQKACLRLLCRSLVVKIYNYSVALVNFGIANTF
jgi:hypothetical protein